MVDVKCLNYYISVMDRLFSDVAKMIADAAYSCWIQASSLDG